MAEVNRTKPLRHGSSTYSILAARLFPDNDCLAQQSVISLKHEAFVKILVNYLYYSINRLVCACVGVCVCVCVRVCVYKRL